MKYMKKFPFKKHDEDNPSIAMDNGSSKNTRLLFAINSNGKTENWSENTKKVHNFYISYCHSVNLDRKPEENL